MKIHGMQGELRFAECKRTDNKDSTVCIILTEIAAIIGSPLGTYVHMKSGTAFEIADTYEDAINNLLIRE